MVTLIVGPSSPTQQAVEFYVHKESLLKIPFFAAALKSGFLESKTQTIKLPEDNPEIVAKLIEFLETGNYNIDLEIASPTIVDPSQPALSAPAVAGAFIREHHRRLFHASVFLLAEKYDCKRLQERAMENWTPQPKDKWELLEFWISLYQSSPPQSGLRITNMMDHELFIHGPGVQSTQEWIWSLWLDDGAATGARNNEGRLLDMVKNVPELARDLMICMSCQP